MQQSNISELRAMIQGAIASHPNAKYRQKALQAVQWRLRGKNGEFVGLNGFACAFVPESEAQIFDGRDNEGLKLAIYSRALGELRIEILPQI